MMKLLPPAGGICLQGEDEIASIGFCLGASMAGGKAMTATSGPGISLCSEQISFAIAGEIPIVIIDVQRLGPSTGSATLGADGDIQFIRWGNSGGFPVIVLAPVDVRDCFLLTIHAFNLAEIFRCPVFVASNKEIGMTRESIDMHGLQIPAIVTRKAPPKGKPFRPFSASKMGVPYFLPMGGDVPVRQTSSSHDYDGYITNNPDEIEAIRIRLKQKLKAVNEKYCFYEAYIEENSKILLFAYGVTARAARAVYRKLKQEGKPVSLLILKTLWPVPRDLLIKYTKNIKRMVVVEMNLGQYVRELERNLPDITIDFLGQMNGQLITPNQIREAIEHG